jgi:nitrate reductase gamma subunit
MSSVVFIFYGSMVFFAIAALVMLIRYVRAPIHLRWEIHKESSIYEESEWWTKKNDMGFLKKLKSAALDILLQREYYRRNRFFWYLLMIFHVGLYLLILWHAALFILALAIEAETDPTYIVVWGHIATALITIGGLGILIKRIIDPEMRAYYARTHYFKWLFIIATLAGGFYATQFFFEGSSVELLRYVNGQLQFDFAHKLDPPLVPSLHMLFISAWMIYLPFSHTTKLFFRYYHELRWDHVPNVRGSGLEKRIKKNLERRVSWSDSHIQTGKTWGEVAAGLPEEMSEPTNSEKKS